MRRCDILRAAERATGRKIPVHIWTYFRASHHCPAFATDGRWEAYDESHLTAFLDYLEQNAKRLDAYPVIRS